MTDAQKISVTTDVLAPDSNQDRASTSLLGPKNEAPNACVVSIPPQQKQKEKKTLKRDKLLAALNDPNIHTIRDAASKAGYAPESREPYKEPTKSHIRDWLTKRDLTLPKLQGKLAEIATETREIKDYSNCLRSIEDIVKMQGGFIDRRVTTNTNLNVQMDLTQAQDAVRRARQTVDAP